MIRFYWRPLFPKEHDPELLWGLLLAGCALIGTLWLASGLPTPLCPLHTLTGIPCFSCGMTRSLRCLLHGNLTAAFLFNPLGLIVLVGVVVYLLYALIVVAAKLPRLRWQPVSKTSALFLRCSIAFLVILNWGYLILRERWLTHLP